MRNVYLENIFRIKELEKLNLHLDYHTELWGQSNKELE